MLTIDLHQKTKLFQAPQTPTIEAFAAGHPTSLPPQPAPSVQLWASTDDYLQHIQTIQTTRAEPPADTCTHILLNGEPHVLMSFSTTNFCTHYQGTGIHSILIGSTSNSHTFASY